MSNFSKKDFRRAINKSYKKMLKKLYPNSDDTKLNILKDSWFIATCKRCGNEFNKKDFEKICMHRRYCHKCWRYGTEKET